MRHCKGPHITFTSRPCLTLAFLGLSRRVKTGQGSCPSCSSWFTTGALTRLPADYRFKLRSTCSMSVKSTTCGTTKPARKHSIVLLQTGHLATRNLNHKAQFRPTSFGRRLQGWLQLAPDASSMPEPAAAPIRHSARFGQSRYSS